jgi:hypothetical protein
MTPTALIKALEEGLEGVTPGPWSIAEEEGWDEAWCDWHRVGPFSLTGGKADADARHIARCSPDNIRTLLSHIEEMRRALTELRKQIETAHDEGFNIDGGDLRWWMSDIDAALQSKEPRNA